MNSFHRKQLTSNQCDDVVTSEKVSDIAKGLATNDVSSESVTGSILVVYYSFVFVYRATADSSSVPGRHHCVQ